MIDANSQFFAILTTVGEAKLANANALGIPWKLTEMAVGDANNTDPTPSRLQTSLINAWRRKPLNQLRVDPVNPAVIIAEQIIPADEGGHWIREIGLYDADGDLVAVANCAPSFKPVLSQGSGRTQVVRMNFIVSSSANIMLKIDPAVVLATREYVDAKVLEELYKLDNKQSVRVATTANVALAGLQTVDGIALAAGDRVLVKNQAVAKDNGLYSAGAGIWGRTADADSNVEVTSAMQVSVEQGMTLADTRWQLVTDGLIVLGTTALTFQNVTQGFAPVNSPALLGTPTAPTPPLFDDTKSLATTEFVKRGSGNYRGFTNVTDAATLTRGAVGTLVTLIGAFTVTLPVAGDLPYGGAIHFRNIGNGVVNVVCSGTDFINAGNGTQLSNISLQPGVTLELVSNGAASWWASGSAQLQYSKVHCTTAPMFDNSKAIATTEFVQKAIGGFGRVFSYGTNGQVIPASQVNSHINLYGTCSTLTLPLISSVPAGSVIYIGTSSLLCTILRQGTDTIFLNSALPASASITVNDGESVLCVSNGSQWIASGVAALKYSASFGASLASNFYQKLPSGDVDMWGLTGATAAGTVTPITFPQAFPNACTNVQLTYVDAGTQLPATRGGPYQVGTFTKAGFNYSHSGSSGFAQFFWRAKGY